MKNCLKTLSRFNKYLTLMFIMINLTCFATYHGQFRQDKFINDHFFKNRKNGTFIDIGAFDGVSLSNTCFFEKELDWSGICIEPIPEIYEQLKANRNCTCIHGCIAVEN